MTDENKKPMTDEEYQYPTEEYVVPKGSQTEASQEEVSAEPAAETASFEESVTEVPDQDMGRASRLNDLLERFPVLKNKRIVLVIVMAIVAIIGFKVTGGFGGKKTQVAKTQVVQKAPKNANAIVAGQLNNLKQTAVSNEATINQLKTQVQQLHDALNQTSASNSQLSQSMYTLMDQVKALTAEVKAQAQAQLKAKQKGPKVVYHLVSVVPGRAWIQGSNGESNSVRVGDKISNLYGVVNKIDSQHGLILTSSGKKIDYGVDDS